MIPVALQRVCQEVSQPMSETSARLHPDSRLPGDSCDLIVIAIVVDKVDAADLRCSRDQEVGVRNRTVDRPAAVAEETVDRDGPLPLRGSHPDPGHGMQLILELAEEGGT